MEAAVCGCVDISVRSGQGINLYFYLSMSNPPAGWWGEWFFLRKDADTPLPVFTGNRPAPQPSWGYGVAWWDIRKLQPLCEVVQ
jgi:hypothetical protein